MQDLGELFVRSGDGLASAQRWTTWSVEDPVMTFLRKGLSAVNAGKDLPSPELRPIKHELQAVYQTSSIGGQSAEKDGSLWLIPHIMLLGST